MTETTSSLTVGVLGAGTMGAGIASVMARAGHRTIVRDLDDGRVARGLGNVRDFLDRGVRLGKLDAAARDRGLAGLSGTTRLDDLAGCDVVVEAIDEDTRRKAETFGALDGICRTDTLFHTNTSTLPVTAIAAGSARPERVVGTHYCNPAPLMKLVEVVKARQTGEDAFARTVAFLRDLGKTTVVAKDSPGFIVNRFLVPFENDCVRALEAGLGTVESIDAAVTKGLRYPMGTFQLLDVVGLDIHKAVATSLYEQLRDPRFAPPPLVDQMIAAGQLGRKTGRGFSTYDTTGVFGGAAAEREREPLGEEPGETAPAPTLPRTVAVLGFGTMGGGIAQVSARAGCDVVVLETTQELLDRGRARVNAFLVEGIRRGKLDDAGRAAVLDRIRGTTKLAGLAGADLVIEAVVEERDVKADVLARVATVVAPETVIATNTSALPVTALAAAVPHPERFAGLHFFNPAPLLPLVEVVRALQTGEETVASLTAFAKAAGKHPIVVADRPGFLVNRLLMPYLNDVVQAYDDGLASARDIDTALELGLGYPMGPLKLLDLIGLDVHLHATEAAYTDTRLRAFAPPPLLRRMVDAGHLGRKTGRGFRVHSTGSTGGGGA